MTPGDLEMAKKVSKMPVCPPAPTVLNTGQFLDEDPRKGDYMSWLLAYTCMLQHVGRALIGGHSDLVECASPCKSLN